MHFSFFLPLDANDVQIKKERNAKTRPKILRFTNTIITPKHTQLSIARSLLFTNRKYSCLYIANFHSKRMLCANCQLKHTQYARTRHAVERKQHFQFMFQWNTNLVLCYVFVMLVRMEREKEMFDIVEYIFGKSKEIVVHIINNLLNFPVYLHCSDAKRHSNLTM